MHLISIGMRNGQTDKSKKYIKIQLKKNIKISFDLRESYSYTNVCCAVLTVDITNLEIMLYQSFINYLSSKDKLCQTNVSYDLRAPNNVINSSRHFGNLDKTLRECIIDSCKLQSNIIFIQSWWGNFKRIDQVISHYKMDVGQSNKQLTSQY